MWGSETTYFRVVLRPHRDLSANIFGTKHAIHNGKHYRSEKAEERKANTKKTLRKLIKTVIKSMELIRWVAESVVELWHLSYLYSFHLGQVQNSPCAYVITGHFMHCSQSGVQALRYTPINVKTECICVWWWWKLMTAGARSCLCSYNITRRAQHYRRGDALVGSRLLASGVRRRLHSAPRALVCCH